MTLFLILLRAMMCYVLICAEVISSASIRITCCTVTFKYCWNTKQKGRKQIFLSLCSQGSRESLQWNACIWQVHQHHNRLNWIQLSLHSRTVQVHLPAPLQPSLIPSQSQGAAVPQVSQCDSTEAFARFTPYMLGQHGHHALLWSISHQAIWAHHLTSLLLMSKEDCQCYFPLTLLYVIAY